MSWEYIDYDYSTAYLFQKMLLWTDKNCNIYFATKLNSNDSWVYYAGDAGHALLTGGILTQYTTEANAQTNYLTTARDSNGKILCLLPTIVQAKYVRIYIETGANVAVYEFTPSTYFTAHEIISGELHITDTLSNAPKLRVTKNSIDRVVVGNVEATEYGIIGYDQNSATVFELSNLKNRIAEWNFTATRLYSGQVSLSGLSGKIKTGGVEIADGQITVETGGGNFGRITVNNASGITIEEGGDIRLIGSDSDPGALYFRGSTYGYIFGAKTTGEYLGLSPETTNTGRLVIGYDQLGNERAFKNIYAKGTEFIAIETGELGTPLRYSGVMLRADTVIDGEKAGYCLMQAAINNDDYPPLNLDEDATIYCVAPTGDSATPYVLIRNSVAISPGTIRTHDFKFRSNGALQIKTTLDYDPHIIFTVEDIDKLAVGVDYSDGYKYKISEGGSLGVNDRFWVSTVGSVCIQNTNASIVYWAGDIDGAAGKAGIQAKYEALATPIVLAPVYIKKSTGDPTNVCETLFCVNTIDNNVKIYADGGWRQLASW